MEYRLVKYVSFVLLLLLAVNGSSYAQVKEKKNNQNEEALERARLSNLNSAQELCRIIGSQFAVPTINYEPVTPPKFWTKGILTQMGFSQVSLTNWAAGGSGSIALNSDVNAHANYAKGNMFWDNRAQFAYGFIQSFDDGYRKSDDRIVLDSKWGYKAVNKFYFSANFNFRSQFSPGFEYSADASKKVSQFLAPAYLSLGLGIDFKPGNGKEFSLNFAPFTGNLVIVTDSLLRAKYGNKPDEAARWALGAQLKATLNKDVFKNCKVMSTLTLFSDYLDKPQNVQVNWDFQITYKLNKYLQTGLRTNLIYDDNILITDKDGHAAPRVQFKEVFSVNFAYTFGVLKK
jgi:hypothetical protein